MLFVQLCFDYKIKVTSALAKISLDRLSEGMILSADVVDGNGRLLAKQGDPLTERKIFNMRAWGVLEADVESSSMAPAGMEVIEGFSAPLLELAKAHVDKLFQLVNHEQSMLQELHRLCVLRHAHLLKGAI